MKKLIIFIFVVCAYSYISIAQVKNDTVVKHVKNIETFVTVTDNQNGEKNVVIETDDANNNLPTKFFKKHFKHNRNTIKHLSISQKVFVLMPIIMFLIMFLLIFVWLRRDNFKLSELFSSKFHENTIKTTVIKTDPTDSSKTITEVREEPIFKRSSSRFIALITIFTIIIIAICLVCYFIYFSISGYQPIPTITGLWKIIATLAIGIIPYSINIMFKK